MKNILLLMLIFLLLPAVQTQAAPDPEVPEMSSYAWGFPILTQSQSSFYSIELPLEVNQSVTDPDLRDAGVYNAAGIPVTRVFRQLNDGVEETEHLKKLPALPLYANSKQTADDVRLLFEQEGDRTKLEFNTGDGSPLKDKAAQMIAYIVDTRLLKEAIEELELSWEPIDSGFIGRITVEGSDDLQNWRQVGGGAVADLRQDGASVVQSRVKLKKTRHDYLRLRWAGMPAQWKLSGIEGYYVTGVTRMVRYSTTLEASGVDDKDGGKIFDLGGAPTIDRIGIVLPDANTVVSATIYHWSDRQARWIHTTAGSFFNVGQGDNTIVSGSTNIGKIRASRFKVVDKRGRPNVAMQLDIGWRPDSLVFLAQGDAPFTLAAGSAADAVKNYPQLRLYGDRSIIGLAKANGQTAEAMLGPKFPLGGADRLQLKKSINWRQLSLWIGLVIAVAFVGFMASRVIRDLKSG